MESHIKLALGIALLTLLVQRYKGLWKCRGGAKFAPFVFSPILVQNKRIIRHLNDFFITYQIFRLKKMFCPQKIFCPKIFENFGNFGAQQFLPHKFWNFFLRIPGLLGTKSCTSMRGIQNYPLLAHTSNNKTMGLKNQAKFRV